MKRFSLSFKPLFGLFCKIKSLTDDIDIDSVPKIAIIPPIEDMHMYMEEGSPGSQFICDVQHFPVADAIVVAPRSTTPVELQPQTIDETRLTVPTFKSPRRVQPEEPKLRSLSPEQRRKFIASLPPPPPPPVNSTTGHVNSTPSPALLPTPSPAEPVSELHHEPLSWSGLFQNDDDSDGDSSTSSNSSSEPEKLSIDQFLVLCLLGKGAQGDVYLVKHRAKMVFYALKAVPKSATKNGYYGNLFAEQFALKMVAGDPRFVNLQATFQDDKYFYILTDLYAYGDLRSEMREVGKYEEDEARQYAAQIAISIEALHKRRILHRDIKPDNLFLNSRHGVVLGDFGLCRTFGRSTAEQPWREAGVRAWMLPEDRRSPDCTPRTKDEAKKVCGTPRYIAPEVYGLDSDGWYSYEADIFSFGVILYELLHGKLPFGMKNDDEPEHLIVRTLRAELEVDGDVSEEATDLLCMILDKDPKKRPNWDKIKAHVWFRLVDWDDVLIKSQPPTPIVFDHFEPTSYARSTIFGEPYTDEDSPFPFFDWTSPEISFQPTVSTTSMYKVSPDWEPTTDILQVMGWPVPCSENDFLTCPSVQPSPICNISSVVAPLSTRKSHSAIVVQGLFDGAIASSKTSSMSSTCAVALHYTAASKLDLHEPRAHPELDTPADGISSSTTSCSASLSEVLDNPTASSEVLSFDSGDIAKALEIMKTAIQDIPVDDNAASSFGASAEATLCSPIGSSPPTQCDIQSLNSRVRDSPSLWSTSARHDHPLSATLFDSPADMDLTITTTVSMAGCTDPPMVGYMRSTLDISTPSRRCGSSGSDDSLTPSPSRPRLRRRSARPTSGSGSEASTSTAVTGSSDTVASPWSSRGSWGRLSGKVRTWWSNFSGGKSVKLRGKRRVSNASSVSW